jgi:hypothetical protein
MQSWQSSGCMPGRPALPEGSPKRRARLHPSTATWRSSPEAHAVLPPDLLPLTPQHPLPVKWLIQLRNLPVLQNLPATLLGTWFQIKLERIRLDDQVRIIVVARDVDLASQMIRCFIEVKGPGHAAAGLEYDIVGKGLAHAGASTPAEEGVVDYGWVGRKWLFVGGPAGLKPAFGTEVGSVGVRIFVTAEAPKRR